MDSSDEDSENAATSFFVTASQIETQTIQDQKTILCSLPALKSPKVCKMDAGKEEASSIGNKLCPLSSEDETKRQEQISTILAKDSESEIEQLTKKDIQIDDQERTCLESFSDEDIVMSPSASDTDANITVICKSITQGKACNLTELPSTSKQHLEDMTGIFQSQGFQTTHSAEECDDEQPAKASQIFKSLQLSGEPMLIPETLEQPLSDSPEIIMSTPRIIPNSPTDNESPTDGSQDLALRLSPSQPYQVGDSPCLSMKNSPDPPSSVKDEENKHIAESGEFILPLPGDNMFLHPVNILSTSDTSTDKTSPLTQNEPVPSKISSLDISHMETQSENTSDTSFNLNVPQVSVPEENGEDTEQNVFKRNWSTPTKQFKQPATLIDESSEDAFIFEKRRKISVTEEVNEVTVIEAELAVSKDSDSCVDSNAETQPSNEDCDEYSRMNMLETKDQQSEETELYEPDTPSTDKSIEIIEVIEPVKVPSLIVIGSEEDNTSNIDKYTSLLEKQESHVKKHGSIQSNLSPTEGLKQQTNTNPQEQVQSTIVLQNTRVAMDEAKSHSQTHATCNMAHHIISPQVEEVSQNKNDNSQNEKDNSQNKKDNSQSKKGNSQNKKENFQNKKDDFQKKKDDSKNKKDNSGDNVSSAVKVVDQESVPELSNRVEVDPNMSNEMAIQEVSNPYSFHATQSQDLLALSCMDTSTPSRSKSSSFTSKKRKSKLMGEHTSSSTDGTLTKKETFRRKRTLTKKGTKNMTEGEFTRPEEPLNTSCRLQTETSTRHSDHDRPVVNPELETSSNPQQRIDLEGISLTVEASQQKSSSSQDEYYEVTTYKIISRVITNKHGDFIRRKIISKQDREDPVCVKRRISKEEVLHLESPARSSNSLGSGELADIESLSRSNSSKSSNPQSLDKISSSLEVISPPLQTHGGDGKSTRADAVTNITSGTNHSAANTPNESPIEEVGVHTGGVEISDVLFTSPDTSDTTKKHVHPKQPISGSVSPLVRKQAADSSSQDTSEIESAQRPPVSREVTSRPLIEESDGFSVKGGSVHSSASCRKDDICVTPTGRTSTKKALQGRGKQTAKTKSRTSNTDNSKTSPEIPVITSASEVNSTRINYASTLEKGSLVMAKWKDGFFYPGNIVHIETGRIQVSFDDGKVRFVKNTDVLLVSQLPIGQSVMVLSNDGFFDTGMILGHVIVSDDILYQVEKDNGENHRYSHSQVILSEDQAACLMSDEELRISPKGQTVAVSLADVSLDNLVDGKRSRSAKKEPVATRNVTMPEPESTEVKRRGRKRKAGEGGPMATSTPTPKGKNIDPNITKRNQPLSSVTGIVDSPSTSVRHSPRKVRVGLFEDNSKSSSSSVNKTLFMDMAFLLTHVSKTKQQKKEEKRQLCDSSSDISMEESSAEEEELNPFNKYELIELIHGGGGVLLNKYNQAKIDEFKQCYLISDAHQRTVKYLQALAAGLPCVSHLWLIYSSRQGRLSDYKSYILPAGISFEKKKVCEWNSCGSCLTGIRVMVMSDNKEFVTAWTSVLSIGRCNIITKFPTPKGKTKLDVIVTDNSCTKNVYKKAAQLSIPTVSTEWVIQSLISGHKVSYTGHPRYRPDYHDK